MPIDFTPAEIRAHYAGRTRELKLGNGKARGPCPVHRGKQGSFSVDLDTGEFTHGGFITILISAGAQYQILTQIISIKENAE